jgi:hypothetical protein
LQFINVRGLLDGEASLCQSLSRGIKHHIIMTLQMEDSKRKFVSCNTTGTPFAAVTVRWCEPLTSTCRERTGHLQYSCKIGSKRDIDLSL